MPLGIRNFQVKDADQSINSIIGPQTQITGLTVPIAARQTIHIRWRVMFGDITVTGMRLGLFSTAVNPLSSSMTYDFRGYGPGLLEGRGFFTNGLPDLVIPAGGAGSTSWMGEINLFWVNGSPAGVIGLDFAQTVSDPTPLTILAGSYADWTVIR